MTGHGSFTAQLLHLTEHLSGQREDLGDGTGGCWRKYLKQWTVRVREAVEGEGEDIGSEQKWQAGFQFV